MTKKPTTGHAAYFRAADGKSEEDGRLFTATFEKNVQPVIDGLSPFLDGLSGNALEIGSGTGQHIVEYAKAFPALRWTPSEPDEVHRRSIDAWRVFQDADSLPAIDLDAAGDWATDVGPLDFILSMNVIHIAPFQVAKGIIHGAAKALNKGGMLAFYGPFQEDGEHTGEGNAAFDARLRADNPEWGVRDVDELSEIAAGVGLLEHSLLEMPANNRILLYQRG